MQIYIVLKLQRNALKCSAFISTDGIFSRFCLSILLFEKIIVPQTQLEKAKAMIS